jgi:hypothetical protein
MIDINPSKLDKPEEKSSFPEKVAFAFFCATSVQFALFKTFVPVILGVKTDAYLGAVSAITLSCAILAAGARVRQVPWTELLISGALLTLAILSGIYSATPWSSTVWALTWGANALGGYWAARLLLTTQTRVKVFIWLCAGTLDLLLILSLWGYYFHGLSTYFVFDLHMLVNIILLLSFSSLALTKSGKILGVMFGVSLLVLSYVAFYVCAVGGVESALLIPPVILVLGLVLALSRTKSRLAPVIIVLFAVAVTAHYLSWVTTEGYSNKTYQSERLEFYNFSAHVAKQSPLVGIGIRTPRYHYLADYIGWHPNYSEKEFSANVKTLVTSQNILLTFMVGFGLPFAALYLFALVFLVIRLLRATFSPDPNSLIPPLALLIPITGAILHYMMMDILLTPMIAWFFHVLLALIPKPAPKAQRERIKIRSVFSVAGLAIVAALLGTLVGTHPAFKPENLPSTDSIRDRFKKLPLISPVLESKSVQDTSDQLDWATLTINIQGYLGRPSNWDILCILDNSTSMVKMDAPWNPNRLADGLVFIDQLGQKSAPESKLAIKTFSDAGPLKRRGREINFRVSRLILPWISLPWHPGHVLRFPQDHAGENNLCAAVESALTRDFVSANTNSGARILLVTDATTECFLDPVIESIKKTMIGGRHPLLDVAFMGATEPWSKRLLDEATETGGTGLNLVSPQDLSSCLDNYLKILKEPFLERVTVSREDYVQTVLPGSNLKLKPGTYDLKLPEIVGLEDSKRNVKGIKLSGGENRVLNILINDDQVTIEK